MIKLSVYNKEGEKAKDLQVSSRIFGVKAKPEVIHQVVVAQQANSRQVLADTKDKSEVRGGGKKPWKQKGTGRARHGSSRSPIWKGGGVTFGPTSDRNFSLRINKKQKQLAMAMCLSDKVEAGRLAVFEEIVSSGKTKELNSWIKSVKQSIAPIKDGKKFLLVIGKQDLNLVNASLNMRNVSVTLADSLNCVDLLKADAVISSVEGIETIEKHYKKIREKKA